MATTALVVCLDVCGLGLVALLSNREMRTRLNVWKLFSFSLETQSRRNRGRR